DNVSANTLHIGEDLARIHEERSHDSFRVFVTNRPQQEVNLLSEFRRRIAVECADYAEQHMTDAMHFETRERLLDYAITKINSTENPIGAGLLMEFGVYKGHSINYFAKRIDQKRRFY